MDKNVYISFYVHIRLHRAQGPLISSYDNTATRLDLHVCAFDYASYNFVSNNFYIILRK